MFNLLNVTMHQGNVTPGADACHGLKECLPRVMEGISI